MCGIAGAIGRFDDSLRGAVERSALALAHRGPDGAGIWSSSSDARAPRVLLAHRRLAIIDLSPGGAQPMIDAQTGNVVVFNGEIYNFVELRAELSRRGARFESRSDTEVLLQAFGHFGVGALERLRGMFACAIFDARERRVVLARDRLGEKPLYWTRIRGMDGGQVVLFASELRALLASDLLERRLDPVALSTFMWNGFVFGPGSIVAGVQELPAGTVAEVDLDQPAVEPRRYWQLPRAGSDALDPAALRHELAEAVRMRLVSDVPLGVFLSGGIDSSAIANLAVRARQGEVHTFNIAFEEAEYDESPHARAVARALGTRHSEIRISGAQFLASIDRALGALDQPTFDGINSYVVSRAVRDAGTVVALAGTGGDELFGGYQSFAELPRARRWSRRLAWLPQAAVAGCARALQAVHARGRSGFRPQTRWGKLPDALAARGDLVALYQVAYALFSRDFQRELCTVLDPDAAPWGLPRARRSELLAATAGDPDLHAIATLELFAFLGQRLLRDTDAAGMAASIEVRLPLLDHVLVERVAALEASARFQPLGRKQALRDAGLTGLDPALFERRKSGFVMPFDRWCRGELRATVDGVLSDQDACRSAGLDPAAVARLWNAFLAGAPGLYWSRVWAVFVLCRWCREHRVSA
ncbi:MAG: asparagine synthase (glutamine-hydrolyzing) [Planctomycetes bacterium]|nr:asparagine synthase (glutamine-hydrolyzing) [Planctomycetota bacterium]